MFDGEEGSRGGGEWGERRDVCKRVEEMGEDDSSEDVRMVVGLGLG